MVTNQGGCDSFGYGTYTIWSKWRGGLSPVYTNKKPASSTVGDPVYDAPGGNIIGNITYVNKDGFWTLSYDDGAGAGGTGIFDDYVNGPIDSTPYFKVPKKIGRVLVRCQKPTSTNNYTWYNLYSDGWVEQGGIKQQAITGKQSLVLPIEMSTSTYSILSSVVDDNLTGYVFCVKATDITTNGFNTEIWGSYNGGTSTRGYNFVWQVSGYAIESEYTKDKWNYQNIQVERCMVQLFNSTTDAAVATCNQVLADVSALNQGDYVIYYDSADITDHSHAHPNANTLTNNQWYRIYKSGWVEQGGEVPYDNSSSTSKKVMNITLPIIMSNTNYYVNAIFNGFNKSQSYYCSLDNCSNNSITIMNNTYTSNDFYCFGCRWEVKGFSNITN